MGSPTPPPPPAACPLGYSIYIVWLHCPVQPDYMNCFLLRQEVCHRSAPVLVLPDLELGAPSKPRPVLLKCIAWQVYLGTAQIHTYRLLYSKSPSSTAICVGPGPWMQPHSWVGEEVKRAMADCPRELMWVEGRAQRGASDEGAEWQIATTFLLIF